MRELKEFINNDNKPFLKNSSIQEVQLFFEDTLYSHFPIVDDGIYQGSLSSEEILFGDATKTVGDFLFGVKGFWCSNHDDVITLLDLFAKNKSNVLPILNKKKKYIGYYLFEDIALAFCDFPFLNEYGSVLVIAKDTDNYSISQVVQIAESNNIGVLGVVISEIKTEKVEITLKLNQDLTDALIQSFRRYGYDIINVHEEDSYLQKLKERSDYLSKYLDI